MFGFELQHQRGLWPVQAILACPSPSSRWGENACVDKVLGKANDNISGITWPRAWYVAVNTSLPSPQAFRLAWHLGVLRIDFHVKRE